MTVSRVRFFSEFPRTVPPARTGTSELLDVVNLVADIVWTEMRRSRHAIEPSQWATLRRIRKGPCTMSELARHKEVSLPTISKSVDMLVRRGWVERWIDTSDRRQTLVRLTTSGRRVLADVRRHLEEVLAAKLGVVAAGQRTQMVASLKLVRTALSLEE